MLFGAWIIDGALAIAEKAVSRGGRDPKAGEKIERLRQGVRSVAIPAEDEDSAQIDNEKA